MKRPWHALCMRIGNALRALDVDDVKYSEDALRRDFAEHGDSPEFWRRVEWHLIMERRVGRYEGSQMARQQLRPYVDLELVR